MAIDMTFIGLSVTGSATFTPAGGVSGFSFGADASGLVSHFQRAIARAMALGSTSDTNLIFRAINGASLGLSAGRMSFSKSGTRVAVSIENICSGTDLQFTTDASALTTMPKLVDEIYALGKDTLLSCLGNSISGGFRYGI